MSRFIEILNRFHGEIDLNSFQEILDEMKMRLDAEASHIEISFPYFLDRGSRADSIKSCKYDCQMHGSLEATGELEFSFKVPIYKPSEKKNHRGMPRSSGHWGNSFITVRFKKFVWIEDLIMLVESAIHNTQQRYLAGSDDLYTVEKFTSNLAEKISTQKEIKWYSVLVENLGEGYSTFASLESEVIS